MGRIWRHSTKPTSLGRPRATSTITSWSVRPSGWQKILRRSPSASLVGCPNSVSFPEEGTGCRNAIVLGVGRGTRLPQAGDPGGLRAVPQRREAVEVLDRAQQPVVVGALAYRARDHVLRRRRQWRCGCRGHRPPPTRRSSRSAGCCGCGPTARSGRGAAQPLVALSDRTVVHVVAEIGDDEGDRRQLRVIGGHRRHRLVGRRRDVAEVRPRAVLAGVAPGLAAGEPGAGRSSE